MARVGGSFSAAGKVRKQTPKVLTQVKPRALTGRSKKRLQYKKYLHSDDPSVSGRPVSVNSYILRKARGLVAK
ncbi:Ribosomal_protein S30 [Hexamita inflata]|uniref:40S ribosomal protein S30 n=1 Tax=Hexamita inflata TaxID=28002 RepID=A0AA86V750_9EUKA|nr:Ribosomal protein S30 [Hexamita inflata]